MACESLVGEKESLRRTLMPARRAGYSCLPFVICPAMRFSTFNPVRHVKGVRYACCSKLGYSAAWKPRRGTRVQVSQKPRIGPSRRNMRTPPGSLFLCKEARLWILQDPRVGGGGRKSHQGGRRLLLLVRRVSAGETLSWHPVTWEARPQRIHTRVHTDWRWSHISPRSRRTQERWERVRLVTRDPAMLCVVRREESEVGLGARTRATGLSCAHGKLLRLTDRRCKAR